MRIRPYLKSTFKNAVAFGAWCGQDLVGSIGGLRNIISRTMPESSERVFFHSDEARITVTESRLIYGNDVIENIANIKIASLMNENAFSDYCTAIAFLIIGGWLLTMWNGWSIVGGILLINPAMLFLQKEHYYVLLIYKGNEGHARLGGEHARFNRKVAGNIVHALLNAVAAYREEHDPREGLDLG